MKERPILFNGPMVRAILEGRKTMTRRIMKQQMVPYGDGFGLPLKNGGIAVSGGPVSMGMQGLASHCPYGQPGDRLWVREKWLQYDGSDSPHILYGADWIANEAATGEWETFTPKWKPSIHMPRWASRITLEIVSVRVELLQDISETDAKAEGVKSLGGGHFGAYCIEGLGADFTASTAKNCFIKLWESINGEGSWNANPWVWVVEFKVIKEGE